MARIAGVNLPNSKRLEIGLTMPGTRYVEALNMRGPTLRAFAATVF